MPLLFWDASALIKRYLRELGSPTVNALLTHMPAPGQATSPWGFTETYSVLVRRHNEGILDLPAFTASVSALQTEVIDSGEFALLSIDDATIFASTLSIRQHSLNATDAAILTLLLEFVAALAPGVPSSSSPPILAFCVPLLPRGSRHSTRRRSPLPMCRPSSLPCRGAGGTWHQSLSLGRSPRGARATVTSWRLWNSCRAPRR